MNVSTAIEKMLKVRPYGARGTQLVPKFVAHDSATGYVAATNGVTAVICRAETPLQDTGGLSFDAIERAVFTERKSTANRIDPRQLRAVLRVFDAVGELPSISYQCGAYVLETNTITALIMAVR